jgi:membrane-bound serine protease (ClpP class)
VLADFVKDAVARAERTDVDVLVLQLNSPGALVDRPALDSLVFHVGHADVPVAVWVGPSGARAYDGAFELMRAAAVSGMAQGSRVGGRTDPALGAPSVQRKLGAAAARNADLVDVVAPTLGDFIVGLDGRKVGATTLETAKVVRTADGPRQQVDAVVSFSKPGLLPRLLHTVSSPAVAYLLLAIGLLLLVFEFFTAGVGVAGLCGAAALVLSAYGLTVLPTRPLGLLLVALGVFGYAVDVQTGVPRVWTAIGAVALAAGGWFLYEDGLSPGVLAWLVVTVGAPLFMVGGMAGMVRSRFSTPTIGRESMIGEHGVAVGAVNPEGTVKVRGALWRARTNRATPIPGGDTVRVAAIDGLLLEVEPLEGAARDAGH